MEARSKALEEQVARDAELDAEELREAAMAYGSDMEDDMDMEGAGDDEMDEMGDGDGDGFELPTAEEREEERKTGAQDLGVVHRRMKHCARVLSNFGKLAAKDRYVVTEQLIQSVLLTPFFPLPQVEIGIRRTASCRYFELLRI